MKFSYRWLHELVPGLDATLPVELMRLITMKTAECEGLEHVGAKLADASVARVKEVEWIAGSHNQIAIVETAHYGTKRVVCGAPNCKPGMLTVYLPLAPKVIEGVESDGMLASALDLGIGSDHSGIAELESELLLAPDSIIEVDNKSLTHRPDLWGHHGMAREIAAITRRTLRDPVTTDLLPKSTQSIEIHIQDFALCPRYSALVFENVTVKPSPLWLQYRLEAIGLNAINNIVDVTNFIMAELAQPMHAFDADKLHGSQIFVRRALVGERFDALNDQGYTLSPSNLVIADAEGAIALAGVIGGKDSAIGPGTTRIVLESANFQAASVRKTSVALKLRTDASMRFEKSQDPRNTVRGLARAIELLYEVSPGIRLAGGLADSHAGFKTPAPIDLSVEWLKAKLGRDLDAREVRAILESLEFGVKEVTAGHFSVTVPSWRATKDISIKDDLVEEVGRMIGYESITPQPPLIASVVPPEDPSRLFLRKLRSMATAQGFTEVYNYSFVTEEMAGAFDMDPDAHIRVANPIAVDQTLLRVSLLPAIRKNILENSRRFPTFRLFEIGREIHPRGPSLPEEIPHFAAAMYARDGDGSASLFELKHLAECLMPGCEVRQAPARPFEHPERAATVHWRGGETGRLFELHPSLGIEGRAAVLDLDLALIEKLDTREKRYQPLRRFPTSAFDLSVVAGRRTPAGEMERRLAAAAGTNLVEIEFVRQYIGAPLPEDRKSVSYRLTVGAADHTLSSDEVTAIRNRVIEAMREAGYELRL
ncbi:MAG TPA: phenylalanine--tRNA ligase subunit beta [Bryobacteraceae bacterium]|nr:phenylalanine--tRNA ligase subunit beta [Bryobacteraceae bacterium]